MARKIIGTFFLIVALLCILISAPFVWIAVLLDRKGRNFNE